VRSCQAKISVRPASHQHCATKVTLRMSIGGRLLEWLPTRTSYAAGTCGPMRDASAVSSVCVPPRDARRNRHACWGVSNAHLLPGHSDGQSGLLRLLCPHEGQRARAAPTRASSDHAQTWAQQSEAIGRDTMGIYRVFAGSDGESHMEELLLEEHPAL